MDDWRPGADLATLRRRARLLADVREFFAEREVLEVQVPVLGERTVTDPDVESIAVPGYGYLQTSPEYFMKRVLAAGAPSVYSIGPVFRADEQGRQHNHEFVMLEWYRLGFDHEQLMAEVAQVADLALGAGRYERIAYAELVGDPHAERAVLDLEFARACAGLTPGRFFVTDYPAEQAALARLEHDGSVAARFELVVDGLELANGYWELTDAAEHRRRFARDNATRRSRGLLAREVDETFLAALEHGLPDCAGVALGIDRLLMLALGKTHIGQVLTFS